MARDDYEDLQSMTLEEAQHLIEQRVYDATALIENLENAGKVFGNGHHARQNLARMAKSELTTRWKNKEEVPTG